MAMVDLDARLRRAETAIQTAISRAKLRDLELDDVEVVALLGRVAGAVIVKYRPSVRESAYGVLTENAREKVSEQDALRAMEQSYADAGEAIPKRPRR